MGYNIIKKYTKEFKDRLYLRQCFSSDEWEKYHHIRKVELFDSIENLVYNPNHSNIADKNHRHFVLYRGCKIIAAAQIEFRTKEYCILRTIAVNKFEQKKGYGKELLRLLENWIQEHSIKNVYLHTTKKTYEFYQKCGYQKVSFKDENGLTTENRIDLGKNLEY